LSYTPEWGRQIKRRFQERQVLLRTAV